MMTTREALHHFVDELPDEQAELARVWLEDLRGAADDEGHHWILRHSRPSIKALLTLRPVA